MNKHFTDSRYYLARAAEHARLGVTDALEAPTTRVRALFGRDDPDPEPSRLEGAVADATALERRAVAHTRGAVDSVQKRLVAGRSSESDGDR
ncbi:DUF7553 family protein [Natrinema salsiterrestre]|uniref:Uncharacterized protein n=1 Tax=Natrinema salsiterrestre TaxID=2950540 RepID=A0A9Q4Q0A0_9EURY|nr:hypothetical protein [Natrinema salsiterrestre]MDF9746235.1 hypothetical protein [Natrinema salsiterrestre]